MINQWYLLGTSDVKNGPGVALIHTKLFQASTCYSSHIWWAFLQPYRFLFYTWWLCFHLSLNTYLPLAFFISIYPLQIFFILHFFCVWKEHRPNITIYSIITIIPSKYKSISGNSIIGSYSFILILSLPLPYLPSLNDIILSVTPNSFDLFSNRTTFYQFSLGTERLLLGLSISKAQQQENIWIIFLQVSLLLSLICKFICTFKELKAVSKNVLHVLKLVKNWEFLSSENIWEI